jgi:hypothetical protein
MHDLSEIQPLEKAASVLGGRWRTTVGYRGVCLYAKSQNFLSRQLLTVIDPNHTKPLQQPMESEATGITQKKQQDQGIPDLAVFFLRGVSIFSTPGSSWR